MSKKIPIIDLFAGPSGLGEGFSAFQNSKKHPFKVTLSIEKNPVAHQTLLLRSFFRQFPRNAMTLAGYAQGNWEKVPSAKQAKQAIRILSAARNEGILN